jgi:hypothetical protein
MNPVGLSGGDSDRGGRPTLCAGRSFCCRLIITVCLVLLASFTQAQPVATTNSAGSLIFTNHFGDLNNDGKVDVLDVVLLTHHINGTRLLSAPMLSRADLNQDGKVDDADRRILANMIAGRNTGPNDDFDGDDLANADEIRLGTNPLDPDTDHDGWLDGWEVAEGTDPLNAQSQPKMLIIAGPPVQMIFPGTYDDPAMTAGGITVARPPVQLIFPDFPVEAAADTNGVTVARPPVQLVFPDFPIETVADTNGVTVARPPVQIEIPQ